MQTNENLRRAYGISAKAFLLIVIRLYSKTGKFRVALLRLKAYRSRYAVYYFMGIVAGCVVALIGVFHVASG